MTTKLQTDFIVRLASLPQFTPKVAAEAFDVGARKLRAHLHKLADAPGAWGADAAGEYWNDRESFFSIANWTSSFPLGTALLAWVQTEDEYFLNQALRLDPWYRRKVTEHAADTMHDLGFLYSLYSVAFFKLTGDRMHRETGLRAAELLAARSIPPAGYLQAWGRMDEYNPHFAGLAIIDCMMNLPLLYWAAEQTGERRFYDVAFRHAELTRLHFVRPDGSVCHAYRFDPASGLPMRAENACGHNVTSHWARGAAWAIYGFALSYKYTKAPEHLQTALKLARKFISHLDEEIVPLWDFRLPPGAEPLRDSSAASIAACGFDELLRHVPDESGLRKAKHALLARLCCPDYLDADESHPGLLRKGQIGDDVPGQARNVHTSWGDYFFMEALACELGSETKFW
ncbi:MAG: glycoside hydrolase family 88 protein [Verrucomicrobia bacterium]|jgi:unsaturated chondroitin disaccharide hydrolase|nr:glycoside hydrolase family 88 protein [Verrucomicrobiota bacterium]